MEGGGGEGGWLVGKGGGRRDTPRWNAAPTGGVGEGRGRPAGDGPWGCCGREGRRRTARDWHLGHPGRACLWGAGLRRALIDRRSRWSPRADSPGREDPGTTASDEDGRGPGTAARAGPRADLRRCAPRSKRHRQQEEQTHTPKKKALTERDRKKIDALHTNKRRSTLPATRHGRAPAAPVSLRQHPAGGKAATAQPPTPTPPSSASSPHPPPPARGGSVAQLGGLDFKLGQHHK